MIAFARMLAALSRDPTALPHYLQEAAEADRDACQALLAGTRPRRIVSLKALAAWAAEIAGIPDWLMEAAIAATGDRAEAAALILPPPQGAPPGLAETLHALTMTTPITAHATLASLWSRLPPEANLILNRLASGTFRAGLPAGETAPPTKPHLLRAVMVLLEPAGPAVTLALWQGDIPVPVARAELALPETQEILDWARANTQGRFGPVRSVPAHWVFELAFDAVVRNRRRKSGVELRNPRLVALHRDADAATLAELHGLLPPS